MKRIDRTGEKSISNSGEVMEIIHYRNSRDLDVRFSDGTIVEHREYKDFKKGHIAYPGKGSNSFRDKKGECSINNDGEEMTIIYYRNANDIDVEFPDGSIAKHKRYSNFKKGSVAHPNRPANCFKDRTGEKSISHTGGEMQIISYRNNQDLDVRFSDGVIVKHRDYASFKKGKIAYPEKNPNRFIDRTGEENINSKGRKMKILNYRSNKDIDVLFSDGKVVRNKAYDSFRKGKIAYPGENLCVFKDRTGEINFNNDGDQMKILKYRNNHDLDIIFYDSSIVQRRCYSDFKNGLIKHPNKTANHKAATIIGETNHNSKGEKFKIVEAKDLSHLIIEFEDGTRVINRTYYDFKKGSILNPKNCLAKDNRKILKDKDSHIGEESYTKDGRLMRIVEYQDSHNIVVEFDDKKRKRISSYKNFKLGSIKYPQ